MKPVIYFHSDDYGMTSHSDDRIEACWKDGCLNSVSIVPNGVLDEAIARLQTPSGRNVRTVVHINLVDGKALSPVDKVSLITDAEGYFRYSFGGLLLLSLSSKREKMKKQIYDEMLLQLKTVVAALPADAVICIDSHQHFHLIPLIFKTMLAVIEDSGIKISAMRIPSEPIRPFLLCPSLYLTYKPINLIKQWVLKFLYNFDRRAHRQSQIPSPVFCGILFSGRMSLERVEKVLPHFYRIAEHQGRDLELLFHPGGVEPGEALFDPKKTTFHPFYLSSGRKDEYFALHTLKPALYAKIQTEAEKMTLG